MKIRILYFAALKERLGLPEEPLELPDGSRVADLVAALAARHPYLRGLRGFRVAVNQAYAKDGDPVPDGAEVALIPPVSGGAPAPTVIRLVREAFTGDQLWKLVDHPSAGAVAVFLGVVRDWNDGRPVLHLEYEAYEAMARAELERVAARVREAYPDVLGVALFHRFGDLAIGEASVGVAVSSPHRAEAFEACRLGIDTIKETVPIWKREHYADGPPEWVRADCMGHRHE